MRLRQLATTQSISFLAPPEVDASIRDVCKLRSKDRVNSTHVVIWLLEQTCRTNEMLQNLYLAQGVEYCQRINAQLKYPRRTDDAGDRMVYLNIALQPERQDLEQQYGPTTDRSTKASPDSVSVAHLKRYMETLAQMRKSAGKNVKGYGAHSSALEEVEQEREMEYQVEEVRLPEKPVFYEALKFPRLHRSIEDFVKTGMLLGGHGYQHVFEYLRKTEIGRKFGLRGTASRIYCSSEFTRSVSFEKNSAKTPDNFLVSLALLFLIET